MSERDPERLDDELLLERLGHALDASNPLPAGTAPSEDRRAALRERVERAAAERRVDGHRSDEHQPDQHQPDQHRVDQHRVDQHQVGEDRVGANPGVPRWRLALAAAVALVVGAALGAARPGPVRDLAAAVGLDVESSQQAQLASAVERLGAVLDDASTQLAQGELTEDALVAVAEADALLVDAAGEVDDPEAIEVAHQVHLRAVAVHAQQGRRLPTASDGDLRELFGDEVPPLR